MGKGVVELQTPEKGCNEDNPQVCLALDMIFGI